MPYVGRFAPSPTGDLHLGTLTAAVASFLHAQQSDGEWLVRIEDIDPPREVPGSAESILRDLERLELTWDRSVAYQSQRHESYVDARDALLAGGEAFYCGCSRRMIRKLTGGMRYPGTCRDRELGAVDRALRLRAPSHPVEFDDLLQGRITRDIAAEDGDFIIFRRDGLPAYHLAVVVDDAAQTITDVVRGADLLDSTPLHVHLQHALDLPTPRYWHIPLVRDAIGEKLSKHSGAAAVSALRPTEAATQALKQLGLTPPDDLRGAPPHLLWQWAQIHWDITTIGTEPHGPAPDSQQNHRYRS